MNGSILTTLATRFAMISLIAIGGASAVVPEIKRQTVDQLSWFDDATFARLFALAQLAPGPNVTVVSLIGWHVAGFAGLVVATLAMLLPSSIIAYGAGRLLQSGRAARLMTALRAVLIPLALGLIVASGVTMSRAADSTFFDVALTAAAALFMLATRANPLWALAAAAGARIMVNLLF